MKQKALTTLLDNAGWHQQLACCARRLKQGRVLGWLLCQPGASAWRLLLSPWSCASDWAWLTPLQIFSAHAARACWTSTRSMHPLVWLAESATSATTPSGICWQAGRRGQGCSPSLKSRACCSHNALRMLELSAVALRMCTCQLWPGLLLPLTWLSQPLSGKSPWLAAAASYAEAKAAHLQTARACAEQGVRFILLVAEATGAWDKEASKTLLLISRAVAAREEGQPALVHAEMLQEFSVLLRATGLVRFCGAGRRPQRPTP